MGMNLNLGCGSDIRKDWINVNFYDSDGVDVVCDLNVYPYPFKDNSVSYIYMSHVLEHLIEPVKNLGECHRILKKGGILEIKVPYKFKLIHVTHHHYFDEFSLDTFIHPFTNYVKSGQQEIFAFIEVEPIKINRTIRFRFRFLRRLGIMRHSIVEDSFKRFGLDVNKNKTFGNWKEIRWLLKKF